MFFNEIDYDYIKKNKGKVLGRGVDRVCYEHKNDKTLVLKRAKSVEGILANLIERDVSGHFRAMNFKGKIALVGKCTPDGKRITQERCEPVKEMPEKIYKCLSFDCKKQNFGILNGDLVKIDFGDASSVYNALLNNTTILYPFRECKD